ncbi:hypothetical protein BCR37DRAFT_239696 [Protomyces lactucae-debilis]|uniref:Uncharacterized protein n=1 Tax=Protomyces lactucae-debilis TaxID=2754530 RepID=A0A1Y2FQ81_PROLT|nr:uncharacterized protein BCR37DRAFT_239696 [Protomyces lactucae-debilis]ORY85484.1 hypothetical protein BCR37DRAFT_239696 [Protomyces lactucae-debilis]
MDSAVMNARELKWTLSALESAPRLYVHHDTDKLGNALIYSIDDDLLYIYEDSRTLSAHDPLAYIPARGYWRGFLRRAKSRLVVTEVRRHEARESAVSLSFFHTEHASGSAEVKTGLVVEEVGYSWTIEYCGKQYNVMQTREAPNTATGSGKSYKVCERRGTPLAWYAAETMHAGKESKKAVLWIEEEALADGLVDFCVACLLTAADVVTPIRQS